MNLTTPQYLNLIAALEKAGIAYGINRHNDGDTLVTIGDNAQSIASLKRLLDSDGLDGFVTFEPAKYSKTISVRMLDVQYDVTCEYDIDAYGDITIKRMMLSDELYPLDWSRKIYGAVIMALESELEGEGF